MKCFSQWAVQHSDVERPWGLTEGKRGVFVSVPLYIFLSRVCVSSVCYSDLCFSSTLAVSASFSLSLCVIDWPTKSAITRTPDHRSMDLPKHQIRATEMCAQLTHIRRENDNTPARCKLTDAGKQRPTDPQKHTQLSSQQLTTICGCYRKVEPVNVKCLP